MNEGGVELPGQAETNMPSPVDITTSTAWVLLQTKVDHLQSPSLGAARATDKSLSYELLPFLDFPLGKAPFWLLFLQRHHIWPNCQPLSHLILTWKRPRSFFLSLALRMFKTSSSVKHSLPWSGIHFPKPSGRRFSLMLMSILKNLLHQWIKVMITMMTQRISVQAMHLSKRIKLSPSGHFIQKLIGFRFSVPGLQGWLFSFLIAMRSFETIRPSLWTCFELLQQIPSLPYHLMSKSTINI